jgi:hypothetical protein
MYNTTLPPYWTKIVSDQPLEQRLSFPTNWDVLTPVTSLLMHMHQQCGEIIDLCVAYDHILQQRLQRQVSLEYAMLASLVHRQVTGAIAIAWLQEFDQPLAFMKEVMKSDILLV